MNEQKQHKWSKEEFAKVMNEKDNHYSTWQMNRLKKLWKVQITFNLS